QVAGADLARVHIIDSVQVDGEEHPVMFPQALPMLEAEITKRKAALLIVDPIMAFLAGKVDTNGDQSSRQVLTQLRGIAERTGCAIFVIRHLNKKNGAAAIYRGGGSIAFIAAARSALVIGRHPDDPDIRVLASLKLNVGKKPAAVTF